MGGNILGFGRNRSGLHLIGDFEAVDAGILVGLAAFFIKTALADLTLGITSIIYLVINPAVWLAVILGGMGFLLFQKALHSGDVSIVTPVMAGFGIVVPVILAVLLLGESVSMLKSAGILIILIGVFLLAGK